MFAFSVGKSAEEKPQPGGSGEAGGPAPAAGSAPGATDMRTCLAELSMEIQGDFSGCRGAGEEGPQGPTCSGERQGAEAAAPRSEDDGAGLLDRGPAFDEDLQAAVDFFRLPPPLLSPVPSPPPGSLPALGSLPSALAPVSLHFEFESHGVQCPCSCASRAQRTFVLVPGFMRAQGGTVRGTPLPFGARAAWLLPLSVTSAFLSLQPHCSPLREDCVSGVCSGPWPGTGRQGASGRTSVGAARSRGGRLTPPLSLDELVVFRAFAAWSVVLPWEVGRFPCGGRGRWRGWLGLPEGLWSGGGDQRGRAGGRVVSADAIVGRSRTR